MAKTRDHDPAQPRAGKPGSLLGLALGAGALVGGLAWWAGRKAREAEQVNPPLGNFIDVSDMRLHHLVRGQGRPVVLLHGLGGMVQDWHLSLLDRAGREFRCIAFDRPGYGHSPRPAGRRWTP